jgi:hypothetical protein
MPKSNTAIVTIGIDPGKNTLHLVGLDARGAIVLREKGSTRRLEPWSRDGTYRSNLNRPEGCKCQNSPCTDCEVFRFSKLNTVCPPTLNGRSSRSGANERGSRAG